MHLSKDQLPAFLSWLDEQGAEVLPTTNPYEVVRFKTVNGVSVIYTGKRGQTFTGESDTAYRFFRDKKRWITHDRRRRQMTSLKRKLANRDGEKCFWCGLVEPINRLTVEHVLNKMHGGSDNSNNLTLACPQCQSDLGRMPISEKILYRDQKMRDATALMELDRTPPPTPRTPKFNLFGRRR